MVKVLTITDEVYEELRRLKSMRRESFTKTIRFLLEFYNKRMAKKEIHSLCGVLKKSKINRRALRRVMRNGTHLH